MAADNEVGFVRSSNRDPKPFPFPLFLDARLSIDTPHFYVDYEIFIVDRQEEVSRVQLLSFLRGKIFLKYLFKIYYRNRKR